MKVNKLNESKSVREDVSYEWKPNTSFKHIKDIYNKVKANDYKYVNNESEEFMAAVKKADNKGYKPEECRQIKDWHRDIWQHNRKTENYSHFEFTSGANPYIAKTKDEAERIKRSRGDSVRFVGNINGIDYYKVDDGEEKDLFSIDESIEELSVGDKFEAKLPSGNLETFTVNKVLPDAYQVKERTKDGDMIYKVNKNQVTRKIDSDLDEAFKPAQDGIQSVKCYNRYNYTIQELRVDNDNKTFQRGQFTAGTPDKKTKNRQEYEDIVDTLKSMGYKELDSEYRSMRNKSRNGEPTNESIQDWRGPYDEFESIIDKHGMFEVDKINADVTALYKMHKGESAWDEAYRRWCGENGAAAPASKPLYVIKDSNGNQLSSPNEDDSELWDRVSSMEARGKRGLSVVAYVNESKSIVETFKPGDSVYVKPCKKSGKVRKVNGDVVEVETFGGKDPDRIDFYYPQDLELQFSDDSINESTNERHFDMEFYDICDLLADAVKSIGGDFDDAKGRVANNGCSITFTSVVDKPDAKAFEKNVETTIERALETTRFGEWVNTYVFRLNKNQVAQNVPAELVDEIMSKCNVYEIQVDGRDGSRMLESNSVKESLLGKRVQGTNSYGEPVGKIGEVIKEYPNTKDHYGNYDIEVQYEDGSIKKTRSFWVSVVEDKLVTEKHSSIKTFGAKGKKLNESSDSWLLIKNRGWYDPEGLGIEPPQQIICQGTKEECTREFDKIVADAKREDGGRFVSIEELSDTHIQIYYPCAISRAIYQLIPNTINESIKDSVRCPSCESSAHVEKNEPFTDEWGNYNNLDYHCTDCGIYFDREDLEEGTKENKLSEGVISDNPEIQSLWDDFFNQYDKIAWKISDAADMYKEQGLDAQVNKGKEYRKKLTNIYKTLEKACNDNALERALDIKNEADKIIRVISYYVNGTSNESLSESPNPADLTDCPECGDTSFDSKKGRCTKCYYRESLNEGIEINNIAHYIIDNYEFDDMQDKHDCINSIRDSFKYEKTISKEELEQFIGAHNGRDKLDESTSLIDKKFNTLGKDGKPMYLTNDQLTDMQAKFKDYDFEETNVDKSLPNGQKAYVAKKKGLNEDVEYIVPKDVQDKCGNQPILHDEDQWDGKYKTFADMWKGEDYKLEEASYGGAFDIEDDQFFTREEINEFAYEVCENLNEAFPTFFDILEVYMEKGTLHLTVQDEEGNEFTTSKKIDMRKIKAPTDINPAYVDSVVSDLKAQIKDYFSPANESLKESVDTDPIEGPGEGAEYGLSELINTAIQNELQTVSEYNSLALNARSEGYEDIAIMIDEINTEENRHIGQLQELLKILSPNASAIEDGKAEGEELLSNPNR